MGEVEDSFGIVRWRMGFECGSCRKMLRAFEMRLEWEERRVEVKEGAECREASMERRDVEI